MKYRDSRNKWWHVFMFDLSNEKVRKVFKAYGLIRPPRTTPRISKKQSIAIFLIIFFAYMLGGDGARGWMLMVPLLFFTGLLVVPLVYYPLNLVYIIITRQLKENTEDILPAILIILVDIIIIHNVATHYLAGSGA